MIGPDNRRWVKESARRSARGHNPYRVPNVIILPPTDDAIDARRDQDLTEAELAVEGRGIKVFRTPSHESSVVADDLAHRYGIDGQPIMATLACEPRAFLEMTDLFQCAVETFKQVSPGVPWQRKEKIANKL
jgi:hypothetical protein